MIDMRFQEYSIDYRLTKVNRPWTSLQVERLSRTIKKATVKREPTTVTSSSTLTSASSSTPTTSGDA